MWPTGITVSSITSMYGVKRETGRSKKTAESKIRALRKLEILKLELIFLVKGRLKIEVKLW